MTDWRTEVRVALLRQKKRQGILAAASGTTESSVSAVLSGKKSPGAKLARACEIELGIDAYMIFFQEAGIVRDRWLGKRLDELHALRGGE